MSTDRSTDDDQNGPGTGPQSDQDATDGPGQGEPTPDGSQDGSAAPADEEGAGREAAGYRRRLRKAEGERDALAERVQRMQRADVERVAAETLAEGSDLLALSGSTLADLLTESGDVDPDAVREAAAELARARPGLRRGPTGAEVRNGIGQGSGPATAGRAAGRTRGGWADALRGS